MNFYELNTTPHPWVTLGTIDATAAAADVALAVGERSWTLNKSLANVVTYTVGRAFNVIEVRFKLGTNNFDVDIDVWAARKGDDNLIKVVTLDVICGQQAEFNSAGVATALLFADTVNLSATNLFVKDIVNAVPGTDHCARLAIDMCSYNRLLFHGYGTFDGDCTIDIGGF